MDPKSMKNMLGHYRALLEREREITLKNQFENFISDIVGVDSTDQVDILYDEFRTMLEAIEDPEGSAKDKVLHCVQSPFFYNVMALKTSSRERELRRLTHHLSDFIKDVAKNAPDDNTFLQHLLSSSLRSVADTIEPKKHREQGQSMNEAWIDAMKVGLEIAVGKKV